MLRINPETGETYDDGLPELGAQAVPSGNPPPESEYSRSPVLITNMKDGVRQDRPISREMTPEDFARFDKLVEGPMRMGVSESGTPWASNVAGWEPPKSLRKDMPQLYKAPEKRDIPPDPRPDMDGQRFIGLMKKEIGYDPETIDPLGQATKEIGEKYQRFGSPSDFYSGTRKMYDEDLKNRVLELSSKKKTGQDALRFSLEQFNKDMEWKSIGAGGSFQPRTGETISPFREPKTPNEIELTQRALRGDQFAQQTLDRLAKKPKAGQNWILSDKTSVISYDEGRSYVASDGQEKRMPQSAIKVPGGATLGELNMNEAKKQAAAELGTGVSGIGKSPKRAALEGTGPYGRLGSAFEAVAGGLGMDILVGQQGFFPDMADAKQYLRSVKQMGKAALMNSARGAIWEQQRIDELFPDPDKTFTNPRIEARKFGNLMSILSQEKTFNNQAIIESLTPKEVEKYRTSNNEIDRLLSLISEPSTGISTQERALIDKYLKRTKK